MILHPDDVEAVAEMVGTDYHLADKNKAIKIITALDAARAKRLPKEVYAFKERISGKEIEQREMLPLLLNGCDILEAQALRIADLTQALADAAKQFNKVMTNLSAAGFEIVPKGAVEKEREACAIIADEQKTAAEKKRKGARIDPDALPEIQAEERGERIASEMIASAIRARGKE